jgi:hypothetical protein
LLVVLLLTWVVEPGQVGSQRQPEHALVAKPDRKVTREQVGSILARDNHKHRAWVTGKSGGNEQRAGRKLNGYNGIVSP